jgi:exopolysaccharide biosynthesis polyprenyl glycosylphosphotransferase
MGNVRRQLLLNSLKLFDLGCMVLCFLFVVFFDNHGKTVMSFEQFLSIRIRLLNFVLFSVVAWGWHATFAGFGLYSSRRLSGRRADIIDIAKAATVGTLLILAAGALFQIKIVTHSFVLLFWVTVTGSTILSRLLLRSVLSQVRLRGRNLRFMLVVGTNNRAMEFAKRISCRPELGYRVLGFVDQEWEGLQDFHKSGYPVVCNFEHLAQYLRNTVVDEVVIALPMRTLHNHAAQIAQICEQQGIAMRVLSNIFDLKLSRPKSEELEDSALINHHAGFAEEWPVMVKRLLDVVVSLVLLVLCAPILVLTALAIKLTSPGPIFFTQRRLGLNKRTFHIYKFRTMIPNAERKIHELEHLNEVSGPVFKIKADPRITSIGKVLRKTSIDELPQLFNVLQGEMSLVGPRPLPIRDYEGFNEDWQRRRFSVRPGITCLWQIAGRNSIPFETWMQLDLQYIDKWSLWLDFEILARTIPAVLRGSGAA